MLTALTSKAYRKALFKRLSGFSAAAELPAGGRAEQRLLRVIFMVLGRLAKMNGRVTQEEIDYAGQIMQRMALAGEKRRDFSLALSDALDDFFASRKNLEPHPNTCKDHLNSDASPLQIRAGIARNASNDIERRRATQSFTTTDAQSVPSELFFY